MKNFRFFNELIGNYLIVQFKSNRQAHSGVETSAAICLVIQGATRFCPCQFAVIAINVIVHELPPKQIRGSECLFLCMTT